MAHYKILSTGDIAAITWLHKSWTLHRADRNQCPPDSKIHKAYGWNWWEQNTHEEKNPGKTHKTSLQIPRLVHHELEFNPQVSARKIKAVNPGVLNAVSLKTLSCRIHNDLQYCSYLVRPKPVVFVTQQEKRVAFFEKYNAWTLKEWHGVMWVMRVNLQ